MLNTHAKYLLAAIVTTVVAIGATSLLLTRLQNQELEAEAKVRVSLVSSFGDACRDYAKETLRPAVEHRVGEFVPEAMSSIYVTAGVFACLNRAAPSYRFRQAALNPLNPANRASEAEAAIIRRFREQPAVKEFTGYERIAGQEAYFVARPVVVEKGCLKCHGTPQAAPAGLVARYGSGGGFGWQPGEIVSATIVSVPVHDLGAQGAAMRGSVLLLMSGLGAIFIGAAYVAYRQLAKRDRELRQVSESMFAANARLADEISAHRDTQEHRERMHAELVTASRYAGMAEVATGVLHNVGNVLNSVNVSVGVLIDKLSRSRVGGVDKIRQLLDDNRDRLGDFLTHDPKGSKVQAYLESLGRTLVGERDENLQELNRLRENVEHIKSIVATQQRLAKVCVVREPVDVSTLVDEAIRLNMHALERHGVVIDRDFEATPQVVTDKHRVLQILVNLISNAKHATGAAGGAQGRILIRVWQDDDRTVAVQVADNGVGILQENLPKIFTHGFTTREDGHGFGLHSGALASKELGGELTVYSDGAGLGAAFTLRLPLRAPASAPGEEPSPPSDAEQPEDAAALAAAT